MPYDTKEKQKAYYQRNKKKILSNVSSNYEKNKDKILKYHKEYNKKNRILKELPTEKQLKYWESLKGKPAHNKGKKGQVPWNKGLKNWMPEESLKRRIEKIKGKVPYNKGIKSNICKEKHWNWKGGINPTNDTIRKSLEYKLWNDAVFARDGYICQKTGTKGGKLHSHHILNFSSHPELRFAINNGITLSEKSHKEFHKIYGNKNNTREQLLEFLGKDEIYFNPENDWITHT